MRYAKNAEELKRELDELSKKKEEDQIPFQFVVDALKTIGRLDGQKIHAQDSGMYSVEFVYTLARRLHRASLGSDWGAEPFTSASIDE